MGKKFLWKERELLEGNKYVLIGLLEDMRLFYEDMPARQGENYFIDGPYFGRDGLFLPIKGLSGGSGLGLERVEHLIGVQDRHRNRFLDSNQTAPKGARDPSLNKNNSIIQAPYSLLSELGAGKENSNTLANLSNGLLGRQESQSLRLRDMNTINVNSERTERKPSEDGFRGK
jgi:hypothetical protein